MANEYEYQGLAEALAARGRGGDSMLMHVHPAEVEALERMRPGSITINPDTGMPEAFFWLIPSILAGIGSAAAAAAPVVGAIGSGLGAVGGAIGSAAGAIGSGLGAVGGAIGSGLGAVGGAIKGVLPGFLGGATAPVVPSTVATAAPAAFTPAALSSFAPTLTGGTVPSLTGLGGGSTIGAAAPTAFAPPAVSSFAPGLTGAGGSTGLGATSPFMQSALAPGGIASGAPSANLLGLTPTQALSTTQPATGGLGMLQKIQGLQRAATQNIAGPGDLLRSGMNTSMKPGQYASTDSLLGVDMPGRVGQMQLGELGVSPSVSRTGAGVGEAVIGPAARAPVQSGLGSLARQGAGALGRGAKWGGERLGDLGLGSAKWAAANPLPATVLGYGAIQAMQGPPETQIPERFRNRNRGDYLGSRSDPGSEGYLNPVWSPQGREQARSGAEGYWDQGDYWTPDEEYFQNIRTGYQHNPYRYG